MNVQNYSNILAIKLRYQGDVFPSLILQLKLSLEGSEVIFINSIQDSKFKF